MFYKKFIKADFERAAEDYDSYADLHKIVAEELLLFASDAFEPKSVILDIGSGTGVIAKHMKNIIQIDISYAMCCKSSDYSPSVNGDMDKLPFADETFDGITSSLVLQWSNNALIAFHEAYRVLKDGDKYVFSIFGTDTLKELKSIIGASHISDFADEKVIIKQLYEARFKNVRCEKKIMTMQYSGIFDLFKKIRNVGGANKKKSRKERFNRELLYKAEKNYQKKYSAKNGIYATWEILYIIAEK